MNMLYNAATWVTEQCRTPEANVLYYIKNSESSSAIRMHRHCINKGWGEAFHSKKLILTIINTYKTSWIYLVTSNKFKQGYWLDNHEVAAASCLRNSNIFKHLSEELRKDKHIINVAIQTSHHSIQNTHYFRPNTKILTWIPTQKLKQKYSALAVACNGLTLKNVSNKTNLITMEAIRQDGDALKFATNKQRNNLHFISVAFNTTPRIINEKWFPQIDQEEMAKLQKEFKKRAEDERERWHWDHN
jgi:hypothetical protein